MADVATRGGFHSSSILGYGPGMVNEVELRRATSFGQRRSFLVIRVTLCGEQGSFRVQGHDDPEDDVDNEAGACE